jgi:hypothetical protein
MIIQSPESTMPEPYKTYVKQRNKAIALVLEDIIGDNNMQLCPRAILPEEQLFPHDSNSVYGAVVKKIEDGYKSVLYQENSGGLGIATSSTNVAVKYALDQIQRGNRVRLKDPHESDGRGQHVIESIDELPSLFDELSEDGSRGCVLMPHISHISQRLSIGRMALGKFGNFTYIGREETIQHDDSEVYGGTALGLFHSHTVENLQKIEQHFDVPPELTALGESALNAYSTLALQSVRVSVDVVRGTTDNGDLLSTVIDITPRVGGTTPAETIAMREIALNPNSICYASSRLLYNPLASPQTGLNFIDTDTLVINAQINEVII